MIPFSRSKTEISKRASAKLSENILATDSNGLGSSSPRIVNTLKCVGKCIYPKHTSHNMNRDSHGQRGFCPAQKIESGKAEVMYL